MIAIFCRNTVVSLSDADNRRVNDEIKTFDDGMDYSHYEGRDQCNIPLIRHQNRVGKKGEYFVATALYDIGFPYIKPDTTIYTASQKSWAADLDYANKFPDKNLPNVHVKSCDEFTNEKFGKSWAFQLADKNGYGTDALFKYKNLENDLVAFVYLKDEYANTAEIHSIMRWGDIRSVGKIGLLELPRKENFRDYKRFVYAKTIDSMIDDLSSEVLVY